MRRLHLLVIVTLISGAFLMAWTWSKTHYPVRHAPAAGKTLVAFGDSLIAGTGASSGHDLIARLSGAVKRPIVNAGVSGDTTASALTRLNKLRELRPDLVIILLGGNDALSRVPVDQTATNLRQIISPLQDDGAVVLLLGIRGGIIGHRYHRAFFKLARELRAAYVPNTLDGIWGNPYLMADEVHPNDRGYGVMAERITPILQELIQPLAVSAEVQ